MAASAVAAAGYVMQGDKKQAAMYAAGIALAAVGAGAAIKLAPKAVKFARVGAASKFTKHAIDQIATRGGSKLHALHAKNFGAPLGPKRDELGRWSYNFATKNTRVAINSRGQIVTYIRFTKKFWRF